MAVLPKTEESMQAMAGDIISFFKRLKPKKNRPRNDLASNKEEEPFLSVATKDSKLNVNKEVEVHAKDASTLESQASFKDPKTLKAVNPVTLKEELLKDADSLAKINTKFDNDKQCKDELQIAEELTSLSLEEIKFSQFKSFSPNGSSSPEKPKNEKEQDLLLKKLDSFNLEVKDEEKGDGVIKDEKKTEDFSSRKTSCDTKQQDDLVKDLENLSVTKDELTIKTEECAAKTKISKEEYPLTESKDGLKISLNNKDRTSEPSEEQKSAKSDGNTAEDLKSAEDKPRKVYLKTKRQSRGHSRKDDLKEKRHDKRHQEYKNTGPKLVEKESGKSPTHDLEASITNTYGDLHDYRNPCYQSFYTNYDQPLNVLVESEGYTDISSNHINSSPESYLDYDDSCNADLDLGLNNCFTDEDLEGLNDFFTAEDLDTVFKAIQSDGYVSENEQSPRCIEIDLTQIDDVKLEKNVQKIRDCKRNKSMAQIKQLQAKLVAPLKEKCCKVTEKNKEKDGKANKDASDTIFGKAPVEVVNVQEMVPIIAEVLKMDLKTQAFGDLERLMVALANAKRLSDFEAKLYSKFMHICNRVIGQAPHLFLEQQGVNLLEVAVLSCNNTPFFTKYIMACIRLAFKVMNKKGDTVKKPIFNGLSDKRTQLRERHYRFTSKGPDAFVEGDTLLHICARLGDEYGDVLQEILGDDDDEELLLYDVNGKNGGEFTALHEAVRSQIEGKTCLRVMHLLLKHGKADLKITDTYGGETALHLALRDFDAILVLLDDLSIKERNMLAGTTNRASVNLITAARKMIPPNHDVINFLEKCKQTKTKKTSVSGDEMSSSSISSPTSNTQSSPFLAVETKKQANANQVEYVSSFLPDYLELNYSLTPDLKSSPVSLQSPPIDHSSFNYGQSPSFYPDSSSSQFTSVLNEIFPNGATIMSSNTFEDTNTAIEKMLVQTAYSIQS